jgi:hypothetical protein
MANVMRKRLLGVLAFAGLLIAVAFSAFAQVASPPSRAGQAICHQILRSNYDTCDHHDPAGNCVAGITRQYTTVCR